MIFPVSVRWQPPSGVVSRVANLGLPADQTQRYDLGVAVPVHATGGHGCGSDCRCCWGVGTGEVVFSIPELCEFRLTLDLIQGAPLSTLGSVRAGLLG